MEQGLDDGAGFACQSATQPCLRVDGTAYLDTVMSSNSAGVVHIANGGDATIDLIESDLDSDVLVLDGGSTYSGEIQATGFTRMIRASDSVTATVTPVATGSGETLVDATMVDGLELINGNTTNITVSRILIGTVQDIRLSSIEYQCDGTANCIDVQIQGELAVTDSLFGQQASDSSVFARLRGDGIVQMDNITLTSSTVLFDVAETVNSISVTHSFQFIQQGPFQVGGFTSKTPACSVWRMG